MSMTVAEAREWYVMSKAEPGKWTWEQAELEESFIERGFLPPGGGRRELTVSGLAAYNAALAGTIAADATPAGKLLRSAAEIVDGARNQTHGDKERSFEAIATLWGAYLSSRKDPSAALTPRDVAWMMVLMKIARSTWGDASTSDHYIDAAGYSAIAGELSLK